jgi:hypothetical protein
VIEPIRENHVNENLIPALMVAALTLPVAGQDAASKIRAEIERIQQSLKVKPVTDQNLGGIAGTIENLAKTSAAALEARRVYLSLERLNQAYELLQGVRTYEQRSAAVNDELPKFESEWGKASVKLAALEREVKAEERTNVRAALRALSETALVKTTPLMEGSRGFATSTKPRDGLFYLGQAQGQAEFARFCGSLTLARKGRAFPLRSMLAELQALQDKTNAAFTPPRSIEKHPRFIALNSTLKLARELDAARFYGGALYQYLEAVRHYAMLDAAEPGAAAQAELKSALAQLDKRLASSGEDDSIAQLFVERAQSQIESGGKDEWRSARAIAEQVIPAYFAARKAPSKLQTAARKAVELTLVRWPYT